MKMFNVHFELRMSEIGDPEKIKPVSDLEPLTKGFSADSPIKDVATLIERLQERGMFPGGPSPFPTVRMLGDDGCGDGLNMRHDFQVVVGSFAEMQEVLAKFRQVADALTMPVEEKKTSTDAAA